MIGILGVHRSGKTTLANELAKRYGFKFVKTSVAGVFEELGLDPAKTYDFSTRLRVQRKILEHIIATIAPYQHATDVITDRTPIDLLLYTLAEVNGNNLTDEENEELLQYMDECYEAFERYFHAGVLLQPGIPIVSDENKKAGSISRGYIEHLNIIALGLVHSGETSVFIITVGREVTDLNTRVDSVYDAIQDCMTTLVEEELEKYRESGRTVH